MKKKILSRAALFIIDPQVSFTSGNWMSYFGESDVQKIDLAFQNITNLLKSFDENQIKIPIIFSKCLFYSQKDFEFDPRLKMYAKKYPFVIKPGNSVMRCNDTEKFIKWIKEYVLKESIKKLVIGGCTFNSCVRVSAIHIQEYFKQQNKDLKVIVDKHLCGARNSNYEKTEESDFKFEGLSPVDFAIKQMKSYNIEIVNNYKWIE